MIFQLDILKFSSILVLFLILSCAEKTKLPDPLQAGWKDQKVCEVLEDDATVRVLRCTFPPGVGHEMHEHAPHFGYTLKGSKFRITDEKGTRELDVPTGYNFFKKEGSTHEVQNIGDSLAVFLIIEPK